LIEAASTIATDQPYRELLTFIHNLVSTSFKWTPNAKAQSIAEGAEKFALTVHFAPHADFEVVLSGRMRSSGP
jgi:predicted ATP-grasp superfamily ATP-dependent carboligase